MKEFADCQKRFYLGNQITFSGNSPGPSNESSKPCMTVVDLHGLYIHFDPKGHWDRKRSQFAVVDVVDAVDRIDRAKRMAVVDLPMIIEAKAQRSQHRWRVTDADREAIVADLIHTGRRHKGIPILRPVSST